MELPPAPEPEPADGDPLPRAVRELDEPAPGNAGWVRALAETATAQREPFVDGEERVRAASPTHWEGAAGEGFLAGRERVLGEWRAVIDTHDEVVRLLDGHNTFVHELQHLWEADRDNPDARRHTLEVHRQATERLAAELHRLSAELDAVAAHEGVDQEEPEPEPEPEPVAEPEPEPEQAPVETDFVGGTTPAMRVNAHLDAQVLRGEWRAWIPWDDEPVA